MPCICDEPSMSIQQYVELMLCKACKHLTRKEMESIDNIGDYTGLFSWYVDHLLHDFSKNYDNADTTEKDTCVKEATRLGLVLTEEEPGMYSIKQ